MSAAEQMRGPEAPSEMPLLPIEALAMALAAARLRPAYTPAEMVDAAELTIDLRRGGVVVAPGRAEEGRAQRIRLLAHCLGLLGRRDAPSPRDQAEAERVAAELGLLAHDLMGEGRR